MNQPSRTPPPCPFCQGQRVWAVARTDTNSPLVLLHGYERGRFFSNPKVVETAAAICLTCGFTALYVRDLPRIREEFQQHPEWFDL